ncbi:L,D-transpeptidase [Phytoactinopolyspora halophila]|uniref:L,D-TPase catalytic domain-containing protein n=1 Tax=Phytoactinopolyspora halophila TaxID=1981511 RepID=A0A329QZV3_9ACTN|nr:Ig-like domain-containing protein [Phytoactinopolyspora halophila]RAW17851.1 hypothetical protein DPM12_03070 [Phytoactinopolyspora halophila]
MRRLAACALASIGVLMLGSCGGDDDGRPDGERHAHTLVQLDGIGNAPEGADGGSTDDGVVDFTEPVSLHVRSGQIESAEVISADGTELTGSVADDGHTWTSERRPDPGQNYELTITASDHFGRSHTLSDEFTVAEVPEGDRLTLSMQPSNESVVGVGAPIVIRFDQSVTEREAVEREMHVSSNPQVVGSWHWVNDSEAHFRPKDYWPAGTAVAVDLELNGVQAGDGLWGGRSYHLKFDVGEERIAEVDADEYDMSMNVDGETQETWDTSLGEPDFATRNGTYVILEKFEERNMTSCSANITCDEDDPEYYDVDTDWAVRLSYSGTFVHSAPWSEGDQGEDNVSHGCINLNESNAETFYEMARYGDVVTVENSTRGPDDLVERGDPGMVDWNQSWDEYVAGSALGEEITTDEL